MPQPSTTPQSPTLSTPQAAPKSTAPSMTPRQHVDAAKTLLDGVSDEKLKKAGRARLDQLKQLFDEMSKAYPASPDWRTKFSAVESQLTRIIGGGRGPGLESATGGSGTEGAAIGSGAALGNQVGTTSGAPEGTTVGGGVTGTGQVAGSTGTVTGGGARVEGAGRAAGGTVAGVPSGVATAGSTTQAGDIGPAGTAAVGAGQGGAPVVGAGAGIAVVGEIGMKDIDPQVREQLRAFRLEVELFFASALTDNLAIAGRTP
jgi:hypothetical protein